jgi:hypothetical protein
MLAAPALKKGAKEAENRHGLLRNKFISGKTASVGTLGEILTRRLAPRQHWQGFGHSFFAASAVGGDSGDFVETTAGRLPLLLHQRRNRASFPTGKRGRRPEVVSTFV